MQFYIGFGGRTPGTNPSNLAAKKVRGNNCWFDNVGGLIPHSSKHGALMNSSRWMGDPRLGGRVGDSSLALSGLGLADPTKTFLTDP